MMKVMKLSLLVVVLLMAGSVRAALLSDDENTIALWHLDSVYETTSNALWLDDDSGTTRDVHQGIGKTSASRPGQTTGGGGYDGEALVFDGVNDMTYTMYNKWQPQESVKIELWFNQDSNAGTGEQTIISTTDGLPWELRAVNGTLRFYAWFEENGVSQGVLNVSRTYNKGQWAHVIATVFDGEISLFVNGSTASSSYDSDWYLNDAASRNIILGAKALGSRHFDGMIDEVKISTVPEPASLLLLGLGGCLLCRKRS